MASCFKKSPKGHDLTYCLGSMEALRFGHSRVPRGVHTGLQPPCHGAQHSSPEGPSTQYLRFLVPKTILLLVFGTGDLKHCVIGPSGKDMAHKPASCTGPVRISEYRLNPTNYQNHLLGGLPIISFLGLCIKSQQKIMVMVVTAVIYVRTIFNSRTFRKSGYIFRTLFQLLMGLGRKRWGCSILQATPRQTAFRATVPAVVESRQSRATATGSRGRALVGA